MADTKLSVITEITAPVIADLLYLVVDTAGTPTEKRLQLANLLKLITGLTADLTPTADDLIATITDPGGTPLVRKVTNNRVGNIIQVVNTQTGAVATGTTIIPFDDTIPQITEGDQYMTLAITPSSATNKLKIEVVLQMAYSVAAWHIAALFQDATAGALAAAVVFQATAGGGTLLRFTHYMDAGTVIATTFRVRAGGQTAGTTTFNGQNTGRIFGGVMASSITITEILV